MIQVDELIRRSDVADNTEFAYGFVLGRLKRGFRCRKMFGLARILRPLTGLGQVFQGLVVLDEYFHERTS